MMLRTTTTTTTQRRRAVSNLQQSTAVILFMLSLSMQSYHNVVAFSSSIISRRGILLNAFSSQRVGVGVVQSILNSTDRRSRISLSSSLYNLRTSSSRLYTTTTTTTQQQTATDNDVVELQYSEFLPPNMKDDNSITHPPVM